MASGAKTALRPVQVLYYTAGGPSRRSNPLQQVDEKVGQARVDAQVRREPEDDPRMPGPRLLHQGRDVLEHVAAGVQEVEQDRDLPRPAAHAGVDARGDVRRLHLEEGVFE